MYYSLTDKVVVYGAALLLAPHRRDAYLKREWKTDWKKKTIDATRRHWVNQYKDKYTADEILDSEDRNKEPDAYDLFERAHAMNSFVDEFEHFINSPPLAKLPTGTSSLDWWLQPANRQAYPSLSRMAIEILSIPAMSAEPERIFSGARRTISWSRFKLGAATIERSECLKSWLRTGIAADWRRELLDRLDEDEKNDENQEVFDDDSDGYTTTPSQDSR